MQDARGASIGEPRVACAGARASIVAVRSATFALATALLLAPPTIRATLEIGIASIITPSLVAPLLVAPSELEAAARIIAAIAVPLGARVAISTTIVVVAVTPSRVAIMIAVAAMIIATPSVIATLLRHGLADPAIGMSAPLSGERRRRPSHERGDERERAQRKTIESHTSLLQIGAATARHGER